jgi:hypothetical protein
MIDFSVVRQEMLELLGSLGFTTGKTKYFQFHLNQFLLVTEFLVPSWILTTNSKIPYSVILKYGIKVFIIQMNKAILILVGVLQLRVLLILPAPASPVVVAPRNLPLTDEQC